MAKVTAKENFLKLCKGGHPDYVPVYTMMGMPYLDECADAMLNPPIFGEVDWDAPEDMWGVPSKAPSTGVAASMPDTTFNLLHDIEDWSKVIKFPVAQDIDYEKCYEAGLKMANIDRNKTALKVGPGFMPFQELVALMGFEGGLCALYTDPDEVKAMLNAMVDVLEPQFEKTLDAYKPDLWYVLDDTCAKETPFFSPEIYKDIFLPIYHRLTDAATSRGIPVVFHNCGKIDQFIPFMIDFGVEIVEPTQESNDIMALKEQYKGKMSFVGGWDWAPHMPPEYPKWDEEFIRQGVRDSIDKNCKGGAYGFCGGALGTRDDHVVDEIQRVIRDEAHWYGKKVYGYTGE